MFIDNKYTKCYFKIIEVFKKGTYDGTYIERHHIVPSSLGGTNEPQNIVNLSAKAHLICHMLLTKMVEGKHRDKMIRAYNMTAHAMNSYQMRYIPKSRSYSKLKEELSILRSEHNRKLWKDPEFRAKIWTEERRIRHGKIISERIARTKEAHKARTLLMWQNPEYRANMSKAHANTGWSTWKSIKCEVNGIVYKNLKEAAEANNCSKYLIKKHPSFRELKDLPPGFEN